MKLNEKPVKLTNLDISTYYKDAKFWFMKSDFLGAFSYWVVVQSPYDTPDITPALKAFDDYISSVVEEDIPKNFSYEELQNIINEDVFEAIPEIEQLNHAKIEIDGFMASSSRFHKIKPDYDYIDLGALARNIFFMMLRESITQNI